MENIDQIDIRRIDGGLLLVLRELCRYRRTTDVALRLGLSQSAVSHSLARLRDIFGDPLFVRRLHGLEPTRRALELESRVDALIDLLGEAIRPEAGFDPHRSGRRFHLAIQEFAVGLIDGRLIQALHQSAPNVSFTLQFLRGYIALESLRRGEVDLALGRFGPLSPDLAGEVLYEDSYCVVARKDHPTIQGQIGEEEYARAGQVFISPFGNSPGPAGGEDPIPDPHDVVTLALVPRWEVALTLVATSDAITTCPRRVAEHQAAQLGLQILELPFSWPSFNVMVVRRAKADGGTDWFAEQVCGFARAFSESEPGAEP